MENKKVAGIIFTDKGILVEKHYVSNPQLKGRPDEETLKEFLEIAKRLAKRRMAHCYKELHKNLDNAIHITHHEIAWKGGHFSVNAYEALEGILQLDDVLLLNELQCQQLLRSLLLNNFGNFSLHDYDENHNKIVDKKSIRVTEQFILFLTEHQLYCGYKDVNHP